MNEWNKFICVIQDTYVAVLKAKDEYHKKEKNFSLNINSTLLRDGLKGVGDQLL